MTPRRLGTAALLLFSTVASAASVRAPETVTFAGIVRTHFDRWTRGKPTGTLTPERVAELVNDPRVIGDEAAAVAAIHVFFRGQKVPAPLGEAALLAAVRTGGPDERRDQATKPVDLQRTFATFRTHLRTSARPLFAADMPRRTGVSQGKLGDCYVLCTVGAMATLHPTRLKSLFRPLEDGSVEVAFPGRRVRVPALTQAQIALGSKAGLQGTWINVLETAVAEATKPARAPLVTLDAIARGGSAARTIELLTGRQAKVLRYRTANAQAKPPVGTRAEALTQETRTLITAVHERRTLACVGTPHEGAMPPGIASGHDFAVLGFDPATDTVKLWNPWGNTFTPKGVAGRTHGYPTKGGCFAMPLHDFVRVFSVLFYETNVPVSKPVRKAVAAGLVSFPLALATCP